MVKEMVNLTDIDRLKKLTGEGDEVLLSLLLDDATAFVLSYTGRTRIVTGLEKAVRDLAVIALNRMGTEGESSRSGGGESYSFDNAPKHIYDTLDRYRLARIGGRTYEAKTEQTGDIPSPGSNTQKDSEGSSYIEYGPAVSFQAEEWPAGGKVQAEMYGQRLPNIRNLRIQGDYQEVPGDGKASYAIKDGLVITAMMGYACMSRERRIRITR